MAISFKNKIPAPAAAGEVILPKFITPLLAPTNPYNLKSLQISNSSQKTFQHCNRQFEFSKVYSVGHNINNVNMGSGTALHVGIQEYLKTKNIEHSIFQMALAYPVEEYLLTKDTPYNKDKDRRLEACYTTLMKIIEDNYLYEYELVNIDGYGPGIEVVFEIKFPSLKTSIPISYIGIIDLIVKHIPTGKIGAADIKTHRDTRTTEKRYHFAQQTIPYNLVIEQALKQKIDNIQLLYFSVYIDIKNPDMQIYSYEKSADLLKDWAIGVTDDIKKIDQAIQRGWFARQLDAYSCDTCQYFDHCDDRNVEQLLKELPEYFPVRMSPERTPAFSINLEIE